MRQTHFILAGVAVATLWAFAAAAQPGGPLWHHHGGPPCPDNGAMHAIGAILHSDDLTDYQQQQVHSILESGRAAAASLHDQLHTANQALTAQLLAVDAPSPDALSSAIAQIEALHQQLDLQQAQTVQSLRAVLTAEQLQQALQRSQELAAAHDVIS